jgi:DNA topoisomerase-2
MAKKKTIEEQFRKLDDIEHILVRQGMYIGSIKPTTTEKWGPTEDNVFKKKEVTFIPGFIKIFDEILINSVDESKRDGSKLDIIKVNIKDNTISIWDNGGIPVIMHKEHKEWIPEMIFSNLKAGSNFNDDEKRLTAGLNGVGSVLTNVFSKEFIVSTCDGKNHFHQKFSSNMRDRSKATIKKSTKNHTEITYTPDLEKFGITDIDDDHKWVIEKRVIDVAGCNPNLKVYFNDKLIQIKSFEDYIKYYKSDFFFETNKDKSWSIGIAHSGDGFQQVSFVNSNETYDGGTHVDYILNQIISQLREFFQKKHKVDIKPSEIKNHLFLFVNSVVVNPSFSAQTKEKLITEVKDFGFTFEVSDKIIKSILKSEIVNSILDWIEKKKSADESKLLRTLNKSREKVDKLIDAKGRDRTKCLLGLYEGDSASSSFRKFRSADTMGAFALRGKFVNVMDIPIKKLFGKNPNGNWNYPEVINLINAIGLSVGEKAEVKNLRYGRILIYTDADCLDENTKVVTLDGLKKISDLTIEDMVLTHNNEYKSVRNIFQKEVSKIIEISVNGNTFKCSEDHILIVVRDGDIIEIKAKDLKYSDFLLLKDK